MPRDTAYVKVADALRTRIRAAEWPVGSRLPSRARLAAEYRVGQSVTQRAMELLVIEGLLEGRPGAGTYVRVPRQRPRVLRSGPADPVGPAGPDGSGRVRRESHTKARVAATEAIAERLAIAPGDPCVLTTYALFDGELPFEVCESWEPMALTGGTPVVLPELGPHKGAGVVARMRAIGIAVTSAVEVPRPARADRRQAGLLAIGVGDLITRIERTHYAADGRAVETADIAVADRHAEIAYEIPVPLSAS
ncbi:MULTISPECIES: GntR family transcriptional regulator [unclassified Streptomyces]|uniref:GntR family transcriptional regulator n=1 Tax=unclassified Streptomyces TaxID=2593676 RepID=UPI000DC7D630|nr:MULTISPECIES: GntR family transcriptional regulator [unclassified Streptomyces]AWZ05594.1 GntR family transcriptional regulator [Streptomyces sp. ICC4]AWZ13094.1 GntR family transcriptional regulator [Streptomyces sp. ICC1]